MIDAHRVVFNGMDSLDFDITPHLSFDSDGGGSASFLNRESIHSEHYDGSFRRIHSYKYNEVLSPTFTFLKQNFSDFDEIENRKILSWLTGSDKPGWIEIYKDDSNVLSYKLFGNFTEIEVYKLGNGRAVGYVATFESNAPYAYSRKFTYPEVYATIEEVSKNDETNDYLVVSGTETFAITCNSDEYNKLLYPKVTIEFKGNNPYFPININPLVDNTYHMVPNVIYSWTDTDNVEHLYVSLNASEDNGRYEVEPLKSNTEASGDTLKYKYCYFPTDGVIKTTVVTTVDGVASYSWRDVTPIGMAARISNTYTLNGKSIVKEAIIAGGAIDETIVFDGANKVISGTRGITTRIMGDDFNWEWIPFAYGDNTITVMGNCTIKFEWLEPRKVGSL